MNETELALRLHDIHRQFTQADRVIEVLRGASLELQAGQMTALVGPSGAGKTTLLNIAGLLEPADSGKVEIGGTDIAALSEAGRTRLRRREIGFVFQFHRLLPEFSALENIIIPQMINGLGRSEAGARASQLLSMVGLSERAHQRPGQLSGGEQQRVAIARSVANAPSVLLADEPTGNLDPKTAASVFEALQQIVRGTGTAALIVTHNMQMAARMDVILEMANGQVKSGMAPA